MVSIACITQLSLSDPNVGGSLKEGEELIGNLPAALCKKLIAKLLMELMD